MSRTTSAILQLSLTILALLSVSACGLITFIGVFIQQNTRIVGVSDDLSMSIVAAGLGLITALLLPSIWFSYRALQSKTDHPVEPNRKILSEWLPSVLMFTLFPLVIFAGSRLQQSAMANWLLPWLHLLSAGLPVYWLLHIVIARLPGGSPKRFWGIFTSGLLVGPLFIVIAELLVVFIAFIAFVLYISARPELMAALEDLAQRLPLMVNSPERIAQMLEPYLSNPLVIVSLVGFIAVIVPVIEETLKPIGVWLLAGRDLTAGEGFAAGAISGAGYALFESLFLPSTASTWAVVAIGRVGTSAMHILACALTGWGLALAWREGKMLRLGLLYLAAIALHSAWNATTVINVIVALSPNWAGAELVSRVLPFGLGIVALASFVLLSFFTRHLAKENPRPELPPANTLSE